MRFFTFFKNFLHQKATQIKKDFSILKNTRFLKCKYNANLKNVMKNACLNGYLMVAGGCHATSAASASAASIASRSHKKALPS
jgi:hypothetical protein